MGYSYTWCEKRREYVYKEVSNGAEEPRPQEPPKPETDEPSISDEEP